MLLAATQVTGRNGKKTSLADRADDLRAAVIAATAALVALVNTTNSALKTEPTCVRLCKAPPSPAILFDALEATIIGVNGQPLIPVGEAKITRTASLVLLLARYFFSPVNKTVSSAARRDPAMLKVVQWAQAHTAGRMVA